MKLKFSEGAKAAIQELTSEKYVNSVEDRNTLSLRAGMAIYGISTTPYGESSGVDVGACPWSERAFIIRTLETLKRTYPDKGEYKAALVKKFQSIQDGTALVDVRFLAHALAHGVLHLSDYELLKLIEGNKIQQEPDESFIDWQFVQVAGCKRDKDNETEVTPFVSHSEAEFYGVYLGKPGAYRHIEDYSSYPEAMLAAAKFVESGEAKKISDKTFHTKKRN